MLFVVCRVAWVRAVSDAQPGAQWAGYSPSYSHLPAARCSGTSNRNAPPATLPSWSHTSRHSHTPLRAAGASGITGPECDNGCNFMKRVKSCVSLFN